MAILKNFVPISYTASGFRKYMIHKLTLIKLNLFLSNLILKELIIVLKDFSIIHLLSCKPDLILR